MTPQTQIVLNDNKGDCFRACLASVLDMPLLEVPNFYDLCGTMSDGGPDVQEFWNKVREWLDIRGWKMIAITFPDPQMLQRTHFDGDEYCIMSGLSPRLRSDGNTKYHAVVGKTQGYGIKIVHDPHPDHSGLRDWGYRFVQFIVKK
jgi:hypothetical protein